MQRYVESIRAARAEKDREFKTSPYSPLTPEQQIGFQRLAYYEPDPALVFDLLPEVFAQKDPVRMMTSKNEIRSYIRWARVTFSINEQEAALTLFAIPGHETLFLPFTDATTGAETYAAGRYLDLERQPDDAIHLDFNVAYNPFCAYNDEWSCPLVPSENRLMIAIRAGEKSPDWMLRGG